MKTAQYVFLMMVALFSALGGSVSGQDNFEVRSLDIAGNDAISEVQIRSRMVTYSTGGFARKFLRRKPFLFSNQILQSDLEAINRLYQREGFLYASAELTHLDSDSKARTVRIEIRVTEGDSITVSEQSWAIVGMQSQDSADVERLISQWSAKVSSKTGTRFRDADIESDRSRLVAILEEAGYPYAEVTPVLEVDQPSRTVRVNWTVKPGPVCIFGDIAITGNKHAESDLIAKSLTLSKGDRYSRRQLDESQRRAYGLSLFHVVTVTARLGSVADTVIPVEVRIKEAPRFTTRVGVGYGREEKLRVYSDSDLLGFPGGARRMNLFIKHSDLEPYRVSAKLIQPAFLTAYTTLEINPFVLRQEEPAYKQDRFGGRVALLHQFKKSFHGSVTYTLERVDLDTTSLADVDLDDTELPDLYNKSSVLFGATFDNSSPVFSPNYGVYVAGAFKISGIGLGSDFHFTRTLMDVRRYQPFLGMVLAGRIKTGGIESRDDDGFVPVEDRFYAGGSASVRGWARSELGPVVDGTPVGGNSIFEASLELRYPILGIFSGALFTDFGNVWSNSYTYHFDDLRYSAGMGIRVGTPIGPVRLDVARPVSDDETTTQVHISVGEAF